MGKNGIVVLLFSPAVETEENRFLMKMIKDQLRLDCYPQISEKIIFNFSLSLRFLPASFYHFNFLSAIIVLWFWYSTSAN